MESYLFPCKRPIINKSFDWIFEISYGLKQVIIHTNNLMEKMFMHESNNQTILY